MQLVSTLFECETDIDAVNEQFECMVEKMINEDRRARKFKNTWKPMVVIVQPSQDMSDIGAFRICGGLPASFLLSGFTTYESWVGRRIYDLACPISSSDSYKALDDIVHQLWPNSGVTAWAHGEKKRAGLAITLPLKVDGKICLVSFVVDIFGMAGKSIPDEFDRAIKILNAFKNKVLMSDHLQKFAKAHLREYITVIYPRKFLWKYNVFTVKNTFLEIKALDDGDIDGVMGLSHWSPETRDLYKRSRLKIIRAVYPSSLSSRGVMIDVDRMHGIGSSNTKSNGPIEWFEDHSPGRPPKDEVGFVYAIEKKFSSIESSRQIEQMRSKHKKKNRTHLSMGSSSLAGMSIDDSDASTCEFTDEASVNISARSICSGKECDNTAVAVGVQSVRGEENENDDNGTCVNNPGAIGATNKSVHAKDDVVRESSHPGGNGAVPDFNHVPSSHGENEENVPIISGAAATATSADHESALEHAWALTQKLKFTQQWRTNTREVSGSMRGARSSWNNIGSSDSAEEASRLDKPLLSLEEEQQRHHQHMRQEREKLTAANRHLRKEKSAEEYWRQMGYYNFHHEGAYTPPLTPDIYYPRDAYSLFEGSVGGYGDSENRYRDPGETNPLSRLAPREDNLHRGENAHGRYGKENNPEVRPILSIPHHVSQGRSGSANIATTTTTPPAIGPHGELLPRKVRSSPTTMTLEHYSRDPTRKARRESQREMDWGTAHVGGTMMGMSTAAPVVPVSSPLFPPHVNHAKHAEIFSSHGYAESSPEIATEDWRRQRQEALFAGTRFHQGAHVVRRGSSFTEDRSGDARCAHVDPLESQAARGHWASTYSGACLCGGRLQEHNPPGGHHSTYGFPRSTIEHGHVYAHVSRTHAAAHGSHGHDDIIKHDDDFDEEGDGNPFLTSWERFLYETKDAPPTSQSPGLGSSSHYFRRGGPYDNNGNDGQENGSDRAKSWSPLTLTLKGKGLDSTVREHQRSRESSHPREGGGMDMTNSRSNTSSELVRRGGDKGLSRGGPSTRLSMKATKSLGGKNTGSKKSGKSGDTSSCAPGVGKRGKSASQHTTPPPSPPLNTDEATTTTTTTQVGDPIGEGSSTKKKNIVYRPGDRIRLHSFETSLHLNGLTATVNRISSQRRSCGNCRVRVQIAYDDAEIAYKEGYPSMIPSRYLAHIERNGKGERGKGKGRSAGEEAGDR